MKKLMINIGASLMVALGLILLKIFTGISIWFMVGIVLFFTVIQYFWTGGKISPKSPGLATLLAFLFIAALGFSFWEANYPLSYQKIVVLKGRTDLTVSDWFGDKTKTKAEYIWEFQKDENGKPFLDYYNKLLAAGKTKEAYDTLSKFTKAWDMNLLEDGEEDSPESGRVSTPPEESITEYSEPGEYNLYLADGQESGWLKITGQCMSYSFVGSKSTFICTYKDGTIAHSWDGKPWPAKFLFKVKNLSREPVVLKVSL